MYVYFLQKLSYSLFVTTQNLIIYKSIELYHILKELSLDLNFEIIFADNENSLNEKVKNLSNYLVLSNKKTPDEAFIYFEDQYIYSTWNFFRMMGLRKVRMLERSLGQKSLQWLFV